MRGYTDHAAWITVHLVTEQAVSGVITFVGGGEVSFNAPPAEGAEGRYIGPAPRLVDNFTYRWIHVGDSLSE